MLNYLWVINPVHKDAVRTITLDLSLARDLRCFREDAPNTCGKPFDMLAKCKGLQHLSLAIDVSYGFYEVQWAGGNNWRTRFIKSYTVAESAVKKIMESVPLRKIRGLKSFEIIWTSNRSWDLQENQQQRLLQMEEEVRKVITS
jgi:hypothetical protein